LPAPSVEKSVIAKPEVHVVFGVVSASSAGVHDVPFVGSPQAKAASWRTVVDVVVLSGVVVVGSATVVGGPVVVVVVDGPAQVPSVSQASNWEKEPRRAPQALPFLHFAVLPTIDDLTLPFFFRTQQTAAFGLPQIDALSHFMMSLRHAF
jgi:hypothetical protein